MIPKISCIQRLNQELLDFYDENMKHIGVASRETVHQRGYWHKTFHCWVTRRQGKKKMILFQRRASQKEIYPNLLAVTASGHLVAGERPRDGIRELEEELGIQAMPQQLVFLGSVKETLLGWGWTDRAFYQVYLFECSMPLEDYCLQDEEVDALVEMDIKDAFRLFRGELESAKVVGFRLDSAGKLQPWEQYVRKQDFVPHHVEYYLQVFQAVERYWEGKWEGKWEVDV